MSDIKREVKFDYPREGGWQTLQTGGRTLVDFQEGVVRYPDGTKEKLTDSLGNHPEHKYCRSFHIEVKDENLKVKLDDDESVHTVEADDMWDATDFHFRKIYIEPEASGCQVKLSASTSIYGFSSFWPIVQVLEDIGAVFHHFHSRSRIYPQDVTDVPRLTAQAVANTFGGWSEIVPLNTVPFGFMVIGFVIEEVSVATTYHVQLGYNTEDADPDDNMELGERRLRMVTVPIARATEILEISSQNVPANSKVMGRVKTATGNADWCDVSVVLYRHVAISKEVPLYPTFPW